MSLSKTWYSSGNLALASTGTATLAANSSMWALAAMLTGNQSGTNGPEGARPGSVYWTLVGSSNGTTAGIDATDRLHLTGAFTSGDWTRVTAGGSAHTWFVLQSPSGLLDGPWYFCFDYIGADDEHATFVISNNVFTGGSTTARPTSTNESAVTAQQFCTTTANAGKAYLTTDANGAFRWFRSRNGTGYFDYGIAIEPVVEYHSGDTARTFMWMGFQDSSPGCWPDNSANFTFRGRCSDGVTALTSNNCSMVCPIMRPNGNAFSIIATTNAIDGTVDALPMAYVADNTTSHKGVRGRFPDLWAVAAQVSVGSTVPGSGNPERMVVGHFLTPGSVAPSL